LGDLSSIPTSFGLVVDSEQIRVFPRQITGVKLKSGQTLNGHNSIIFKYYEKEKYRFESKFNLVFIFINLYSQSSSYYGH